MKPKGKIILIGCVSVLFFFLASLGGMFLYYYTHPSAVKGFVEKSVSNATKTSFTMRRLSYSLSPLRFSAKGLTFKPQSGLHGFYLDIPDVTADLSLEGPFGHKRLRVKHLEVKGLLCRIQKDVTVPAFSPGGAPASFFGTMLRRLIAFFVFRDITVEDATLSDARMTAQLGDQTLRVTGIHGHLNPEHQMELSCGIRFKWPSRKVDLLVPHVRMKTDGVISLVDPQIECSITCDDALFESPVINAGNIQAGARLRYRPGTGHVIFDPVDLTLDAAEIKEDGQWERVRLGLRVKADGAFSLKDRQLTAKHFNLTLIDRLQLTGELNAAVGSRKAIRLNLATCRVTPQELIRFLPSGIQKQVRPLKLAGQIHLSGRVGGVEEKGKWAWDADLEAQLRQHPISFTTHSIRASGAVTGEIRAQGRVPDLKISATLKAEQALFSGNGMDVAPFEVALSLSG
ncbi:MAG: hypothetical protein JRL30_26350, partial [Deltaproteobacteria bacterium]|nr:hypothetical protein [Deltaproteobacteria bacterium]